MLVAMISLGDKLNRTGPYPETKQWFWDLPCYKTSIFQKKKLIVTSVGIWVKMFGTIVNVRQLVILSS